MAIESEQREIALKVCYFWELFSIFMIEMLKFQTRQALEMENSAQNEVNKCMPDVEAALQCLSSLSIVCSCLYFVASTCHPKLLSPHIFVHVLLVCSPSWTNYAPWEYHLPEFTWSWKLLVRCLGSHLLLYQIRTTRNSLWKIISMLPSSTYWKIRIISCKGCFNTTKKIFLKGDGFELTLDCFSVFPTSNTISRMRVFMEDPKFEPDSVKYSSVAAMAVCMWVRAMYDFHHVYHQTVKPKKEHLLKIAGVLLLSMMHSCCSCLSFIHFKYRMQFHRLSANHVCKLWRSRRPNSVQLNSTGPS